MTLQTSSEGHPTAEETVALSRILVEKSRETLRRIGDSGVSAGLASSSHTSGSDRAQATAS